MSEIRLSLLGDAAALAAVRATAGSQRDNLCGAFWAALALRAFYGADYVNEEQVALAAGTVVVRDDPDPNASLPWRGAGQVVSSGPYRLALPSISVAAESGTSPAGVAHALAVLSGDSLSSTPVTSPHWTGPLVVTLLDRLAALPPGPLLAIANIATRHLDGSRRGPADVLNALLTGIPLPETAPDWDVGHFLVLAGLVHGPAASLVVVCDTYEAFGAAGWGVQRPEAIAAALHRDGGGTGGVLLVSRTEDVGVVRAALGDLDIEQKGWGNGSPEPPGFTFE